MRDLRAFWIAFPACLAACGGVEATPTPDGAAVDASTVPDATVAGDVTVRMPGPPADAVAIFLDPAGVTVDVVPLAPSGVATRALLPGSSVSVVAASTNYVYHFTGVQPGDELPLYGGGVDPTMLAVSIAVPTTPGTDVYRVLTPCGSADSATSPVGVTLYDCGDTTDVFVIADGATDKTVFKPAVPVAASMTVTGLYQPLSPLTVDVTNVPASATYLDVYGATYTAGGQFYMGFGYGDSFAPPSPTASIETEVPTVDDLWIQGTVYTDSALGQQSLVYREPADTQAVFDLSELTSPYMRNVAYDLDQSAVVWTSVGDGSPPVLAEAEYYVNAGDGSTYVQLIGPVTSPGRLDVPVLPAPYDIYNVAPGHTVNYSFAFTLLTDAASADEIRQRYFGSYVPHPREGRARMAFGTPAP